MKHIVNIGAMVIIALVVIIAGVGSYKAHSFSMSVDVPEVVPERIVEVKYVEVAPEVEEVVIPEEPTKTDARAEVAAEIRKPTPAAVIRESGFLNLTFEDMDLLERVAMAEAEGEDTIGKALVMLTVINRAEICNAPIGEIIYAPGQFCTTRMWITPTDDCHEALAMVMDGWNETMLETEEEWDRTKRIFYFGADGYSEYGEPAFQYGGHYFSVR